MIDIATKLLSVEEAADLLNLSLSTFIRLLDTKEIRSCGSGNRRKVAFADLKEYKNRLSESRLAALAELSALDQEIDSGY